MASKIVKILTCDRCGKTILLDSIGERIFKKEPADWEVCTEVGTLCPKCNSL